VGREALITGNGVGLRRLRRTCWKPPSIPPCTARRCGSRPSLLESSPAGLGLPRWPGRCAGVDCAITALSGRACARVTRLPCQWLAGPLARARDPA